VDAAMNFVGFVKEIGKTMAVILVDIINVTFMKSKKNRRKRK